MATESIHDKMLRDLAGHLSDPDGRKEYFRNRQPDSACLDEEEYERLVKTGKWVVKMPANSRTFELEVPIVTGLSLEQKSEKFRIELHKKLDNSKRRGSERYVNGTLDFMGQALDSRFPLDEKDMHKVQRLIKDVNKKRRKKKGKSSLNNDKWKVAILAAKAGLSFHEYVQLTMHAEGDTGGEVEDIW